MERQPLLFDKDYKIGTDDLTVNGMVVHLLYAHYFWLVLSGLRVDHSLCFSFSGTLGHGQHLACCRMLRRVGLSGHERHVRVE